jgi:hypothetical protein
MNFESHKWLLVFKEYERLEKALQDVQDLQVYGLYGCPVQAEQVVKQLLQLDNAAVKAAESDLDQIIAFYKRGGTRLCVYYRNANQALYTSAPYKQGSREEIYPRILLDLAPTLICCPPAKALEAVYSSPDPAQAHPFVVSRFSHEEMKHVTVEVAEPKLEEIVVNFEGFLRETRVIVPKDSFKYVFLLTKEDVNLEANKANEAPALNAVKTALAEMLLSSGEIKESKWSELRPLAAYQSLISSLYTNPQRAVEAIKSFTKNITETLRFSVFTPILEEYFAALEAKFTFNPRQYSAWKETISKDLLRPDGLAELSRENLRNAISEMKGDEFGDSDLYAAELTPIIQQKQAQLEAAVREWVPLQIERLSEQVVTALKDSDKSLREVKVTLRTVSIEIEGEDKVTMKITPFQRSFSFKTDIKQTRITIVDEKIGFVGFLLEENAWEIHKFNPVSNSRLDTETSVIREDIVIVRGSTVLLFAAYQPSKRLAYYGPISQGRVISTGKELNLYGRRVDSIKSAVLLPNNLLLYFLNQLGELFSMDLRDEDENQEPMEVPASNGPDSLETKIVPVRAANREPFEDVQSSKDETTLFLLTMTTVEIYDNSFTRQKVIQLASPGNMKVISDEEYRNYVVQYTQEKPPTGYLYYGAGSYAKMITRKSEKQRVKGNPVVDILGFVERKFGSMESATRRFYLSSPQPEACEGLLDYSRFIPELQRLFSNMDILQEASPPCIKTPAVQLLFRVGTLQPVHICSIQEGNLTPLRMGRSQVSEFRQALKSSLEEGLIETIINFTHIGDLETILGRDRRPPIVVSIMGKQSSGKSYLMNQLFGSRFDVASSRCTDGIWMSVSSIEGRLIIALDCEGLFSIERSEQEEMKLCLFISAISDVTIVNVDQNVSKHLTDFLDKFTSAASRLQGTNLFKGMLSFVLRDLTEKLGAFANLNKVIESLRKEGRGGFIEKVFSGIVHNAPMHFYQKEEFHGEIVTLRKVYMDKGSHWEDSRTFVETMKLVLAQIYADDVLPVESRQLGVKLKNNTKNVLRRLLEGSDIGPYLAFDKDVCVRVEIREISKEIRWKVSEAHRNKVISLGFFIDLLKVGIGGEMKFRLYHKELFKYLEKMTNEHFVEIKGLLIMKFKQLLPENHPQIVLLEDHCKLFSRELIFLEEKLRFCGRKCANCCLQCLLVNQHEGEDNCLTDHRCHQPCSQCKGKFCCKQANHQFDHLCIDIQHTCKEICQICPTNSPAECSKPIGHEGTHSCGSPHRCGRNCEMYEHCKGKCVIDRTEEHTQHTCGYSSCSVRCKYPDCKAVCCEEDHFHGLRPNARHMCAHPHKCKKNCSLPGICSFTYITEIKPWGTAGLIEYVTIHKPREKDECTVMIQEGSDSHPGPHKCDAEKHHCPARCPDCTCFCEFEPNHSGDHQAEAHRNKTNCIYIHKENVISVDNGRKKTGATFATAGEMAAPEFCHKSCERKGRGHFHPLACPGSSNCLMRRYNGKAWHTDTKLKGTNISHWDMLECRMYYKHFGWRAPIDTVLGSRKQDTFALCPFFCSEQHPSNQLSLYCERLLFHSMSTQRRDHFFTCRHPSAESFDVCFVLDCTGSMGWCFQKVLEILKSVLRERAQADIKFAIVAYTDHLEESKGMMADQAHPVKVYPGSYRLDHYTEADMVTVLENLEAGGGGGMYGEAVIDGLHEASKLIYREGAQRVIYLIADDTAHGLEFYNGTQFDYGCPCGYRWRTILSTYKSHKALFKVVKLSPIMTKLCELFQGEYGVGFEVVTMSDLGKFAPIVAQSIVKTIDYCLEFAVA